MRPRETYQPDRPAHARPARPPGLALGRAALPASLLAALVVGCGARTQIAVEGCAGDAGLSRACATACGEGTQRCSGGAWGACEVPPNERSCEATCGVGTQRCQDGSWGACVGPPTGARACANACGTGTQTCREEVWSACAVPVTSRACADVCGEGSQTCADGTWSACAVPLAERPCSTACGEGSQLCRDGAWGPCSASMPRPPSLRVVVRDFRDEHPDMEAGSYGHDPGIVEARLGADGLPVYAGRTPTTHGREAFDQWYRDVPGINERAEIDLALAPSPADPARFVFEDLTFFPIDGRLFGNQGYEHNFHFTLEAEATFVYRGGETFRFQGDDDVFVFIDGRLVIDLGGVHGALEGTVELDSLGLVLGERYPLRLFFAERHSTESTFSIETTLSEIVVCD